MEAKCNLAIYLFVLRIMSQCHLRLYKNNCFSLPFSFCNSTMVVIDPAFVQSLEHRPKQSNVVAQGIPQIDLTYINSPGYDASSPEALRLARDIGDACKNWGFFKVVNHGVPWENYQRLQLAGIEFFALPADEKRKVTKDEANPLGYYYGENTKNVRDWKEVFDLMVKNPSLVPASHEVDDMEVKELVQRWPEYPPQLREAFKEYAGEMEKLSRKLLQLISLSLGLAEDRLGGFFENHMSYLRLNHYPPCPDPLLALGVGRHKDGGALTILAQDEVGGLEVKRKADGEWVRVKPTPCSYIIMQVWSNGAYESVEHRVVVNGEKERFSIPFFFNPDHHVMVEPLSELVTKENPAKYRAYNWGKFFMNRRHSNFKKLKVENIQISHFRIAQ